MNINFLKITLGLALATFAINANAQKAYNQGLATYGLTVSGVNAESKVYFSADSAAAVTAQGPANVTFLTNNKGTFIAILVNVPVVSMKKAAVLTPDEIDQMLAAAPKFTFTPSTETKVINGFNCKKVTAKDTKSGSSYDTWITSDITLPINSLSKAFADAGGVPVKFTTMQQGQAVAYELKSISEEKPPAGIFSTAGYEKISLDDLKSMGGR